MYSQTLAYFQLLFSSFRTIPVRMVYFYLLLGYFTKWDGLKISPICLFQCFDKISVPAIFSDHRFGQLCSGLFVIKGNPLKIKFTRDKKGQNESSMSYLYKGFSRKLEILGGFGEIGLETNAKTSFILNK